MHALLLTKENVALAQGEAQALLPTSASTLHGNLLLQQGHFDVGFLSKRLAYTKALYKVLFSCPVSELEKKIPSYRWHSVLDTTYVLRCFFLDGKKMLSEKATSSLLLPFSSLSFSSPRSTVHVFTHAGVAHVCVLLGEILYDYDARKPHRRPAPHPSSMHPRLARAMVNLTGIRRGTLLDPLCGAGGILLEAGLMGLSFKGYDIDPAMITRAQANFVTYPQLKPILVVKDALSMKAPIRHLATDLPYGQNTITSKDLAARFFSLLGKLLRGRAVVGVPIIKGKTLNWKHLLERASLRLLGTHDIYLHKSLSKRILSIESSRRRP